MTTTDYAYSPAERQRRLVITIILGLSVASSLSATATFGQLQDSTQTIHAAGRRFHFTEVGVTFDGGFPSARISDCQQIGEDAFRIVIRPENAPINNSPWYAFKVASERPKTISIELTYEDGSHRYRPKLSQDGVDWTPLDDDAFGRGSDKKSCWLRLSVASKPLWVAGQEMVGVKQLNAWLDRMARLPFADKSVLGHSVEGRPIHKLDLSATSAADYVVIIGRQHPPEVTGSMGLMAFVEALAGDNELARQFRSSFSVVVIPLVNPDGVDLGHWRHNVNGVDLNRDWGKFEQPETCAVRDEVTRLEDTGRLFLFLDFHSTHHDVFYTQSDAQETFPSEFSPKWIDAIRNRVPAHSVRRVNTSGKQATSQRWVYQTWGVASVTYELGDNTDRDQIRRVAKASAEEMMRLLLDAQAVNCSSAGRTTLQPKEDTE